MVPGSHGAWITDSQLLINKLERVQHHVTCWVTGENQRMASVTEMLATLSWVTQEVRKSKIRLAMSYKILNNLIAIQTTQLMNRTTQCNNKKQDIPSPISTMLITDRQI